MTENATGQPKKTNSKSVSRPIGNLLSNHASSSFFSYWKSGIHVVCSL